MATGVPSSSFSRTMLNLWIGLCRGVAGLPRDLRERGYTDKWIDYKFPNQDLRSVCPDLIIASERVRHTVLLEWKGGATTDADQFQRYSRVTGADLEQKAVIPVAAARQHDVAIVGEVANADALKATVGAYPFPVVVRDEAGMVLSANAFKVADINALSPPGS
jgi:hypothetical protein